MIVCVPGRSQTFTLPTSVLDSLIFEVRKGRMCDSLQESQSRLILATQEQLLTRDKVIALQGTQIENSAFIQATWEKRYDNAQELYQIDKQELKHKIRKRNRIILGESAIILLLLFLI